MQEVLHHKVRRMHPAPAPEDDSWRAAWIRAIDVIVYPVGFLGIAAAIPQLTEIWINHNAAGISPISWGMWGFFSIIWAMYGIAHRTHVTVIINSVWCVINFAVAIGAHLYG
jgi:uncharacterized protein with PQ loop repeat